MAMEMLEVNRVHGVVHALQPGAGKNFDDYAAIDILADIALVAGKEGSRLRAHVRPE